MKKYPANSPIDSLLDLACRDGVDVRPTLLRVLTDLYVQKDTHSADEEVQYVELALGLIDAADERTRVAVAASLASYPAAPTAVVARLAGHASPAVTAVTEPSKEADFDAGTGAEACDLAELFFAADADERRLILLNLDSAATGLGRLAAPVSGEIIKRLENAALQRNAGEFSRILERALAIDRGLAERVTRDLSGEPIVVAAKALGAKAAVLQRILLFLNPAIGQSVQKVYELAKLYDELSREASIHMLTIWRQSGAPARPVQKPVHEPVYGADATGNARVQPTPKQHRVARELTQQPERFKSTR
ncbi:MAG: DUF2336 domain-containing protein [Pseudolabrys sp.]|nr:DUF2336 domain-containing protein [Pseudolabrys sp.]